MLNLILGDGHTREMCNPANGFGVNDHSGNLSFASHTRDVPRIAEGRYAANCAGRSILPVFARIVSSADPA